MKRNNFILYGFFFLSCTNCIGDANVNSEFTKKGNNIPTQEAPKSIKDTNEGEEKNKKTKIESKKEESQQTSSSDIKEVVPPLKEEPISVKVIEKTPCESLYETYKESVEKYVASKEMSDLDKILNFSNSPTFEDCRKDNAFKGKFDLLDERMESVEN